MKYRREIDGLRAVAVLPVILFHAGFKAFEGGFVGVDVFFVISGYLITTIILSDMNKGQFSIVAFYERRTRRILPGLFFVMLCCLPFAWLWLAPSHLKDFCQSLTGVSLFSSNILFWKESGYFDTAAELKPLLHTWSLAVEEQYYVLFPLFLMLLWKSRRHWIFGSLLLISLVSLVGAQYGAYRHSSATFFLLHTRAWELAIGALVAFYLLYKKEQDNFVRSHRIISEALGFVGLSLILYSILAFDENTPFPGFFALVPTIGTALIIIFITSQTAVGRLLGAKIVVGAGLISYSAYLWHQPLFALARHRSSTELSVELLLALSALSLILAYVTWRFIETPFRSKEGIDRRKIFSFAVVGSAFFATVGVTGHLKSGFPERLGYPGGLMASFERSSPTGECFDKSKIHEVDDWYCEFGKKDAKSSFFVFGDSHVLSLFDAFGTSLGNLDLSGVFAGASGCTPLLGIHALRSDQEDRNCHELNNRVFNFVTDNNIKDIFLIARWTYYTDGGHSGENFSYIGLDDDAPRSKENSRNAFVFGFNKTIDEYKKHGVVVHIVQQVPQQTIHPASAYQRAYMFDGDSRGNLLQDMSVSLAEHKKLNNYVSAVFSENEYAQVINFDSLLCNSEGCPIGTIEESYYFDDDHLSLVGARRLIPSIENLLERIGKTKFLKD